MANSRANKRMKSTSSPSVTAMPRVLLWASLVLTIVNPVQASQLQLEPAGSYLWAEPTSVASDDSNLIVGYPNGFRFYTEDPHGQFALNGSYEIGFGVAGFHLHDHVAIYLNHAGHLRALDLIDPAAPNPLGCIDSTADWTHIAVTGTTLLLLGDGRVASFDISDPRDIRHIAEIPLNGGIESAAASDSLLVIAQGAAGLRIVIVRPDGALDLGGVLPVGISFPARSVATDGRNAWLAQGINGILVADLGDPYAPTVASHVATFGFATRLARVGDRLVVADAVFGLISYLIVNPTVPIYQHELHDLPSIQRLWMDSGQRLYSTEGTELAAVDIDRFGRLSLAGQFGHPGGYRSVAHHGGWLYIPDRFGFWRAKADSISDDTSFTHFSAREPIRDASAADGHLFLSNGSEGASIFLLGFGGNLSLRGRAAAENSVTGTTAKGNTLIAIEGGYGFRIFDITDIRNPEYRGRKRRSVGLPDGYLASERYLYLSEAGRGVRIYDLRRPVKPTEVRVLPQTVATQELHYGRGGLYAADAVTGISRFDLTDLRSPGLAAHLSWPDSAATVLQSGRTLYVGDRAGRITMLDLADLSQGIAIGSQQLPASIQRIAKSGERLCVTTLAAVHLVDVGPALRPGDFNADGTTDATDLIALIDHAFGMGLPPFRPNAADVNADGVINLVDVVRMIGFLFNNGPPLEIGQIE